MKAASTGDQEGEDSPQEVPGYVRVRLVRDNQTQYAAARIMDSGDAGEVVRALIADSPREVFLVLFLDNRHHVSAVHRVSEGRIDSTPADPREVFQAAILANARRVILAHNHPSGDPEPSPQDVALTRRLCAAGQLLGIEVLDHIVVGDRQCVSLRCRHPDLGWESPPPEDAAETTGAYRTWPLPTRPGAA